VKFVACPQCETLILSGIEAGITVRLSTLTVPESDARVLRKWGLLVYSVRLFGEQIIAELWSPIFKDSKWLTIEHDCSRDISNWYFNTPKYPATEKRPRDKAPSVRGFDD
jgi:hypothetical protein